MQIDLKNEYRVYVIEEDDSFPSQNNFEYVKLLNCSKSSYARNIIAYPWELKHNPIDVLLTYTAAPWFVKCKIVLLLADIFWIAHPEWIPKKFSIPLGISTRMAVKRADKIVTTTQFSKKEIMRYLNVPEEKIEVVHHGIRNRFLVKADEGTIERVKQKYGIQGPYILSINDIHPRKNLDGLVEAFNLMQAQEKTNHCLVFVGRTLWPYNSFFEKIKRSPFKEKIIMTGYVDSEDINPLLQGAELFMYPSFYEGWGLQVHEAMSAGTPVGIANNTTMPEISEGAAAEFNPYDPLDMCNTMKNVLTSPQLQQEMVRKGKEQVKKFSWERAAIETLEICKKVHER